MTGFDKALLSVAEGLSTNGLHTLQLILLGLITPAEEELLDWYYDVI